MCIRLMVGYGLLATGTDVQIVYAHLFINHKNSNTMGGNLYPADKPTEKPETPTEETTVTKTTTTTEETTETKPVKTEERHSGPSEDKGAE